MEIDFLKEKLLPVFEKHKIEKAILFGSFARGESTRRSNVDLILIKETRKRFLDRYEGLLLDCNLAISDRPVDVLIYTPAELEQISGRTFVKRALAEGVVLYETT